MKDLKEYIKHRVIEMGGNGINITNNGINMERSELVKKENRINEKIDGRIASLEKWFNK